MGARVGHQKFGGRPKGVKNKDKECLREKARKLGVDPLEVLLLFAKNDWAALGYKSEFEEKFGAGGVPCMMRVITPDVRMNAAKEACQYLYPKKKAIEVGFDQDNPQVINLAYSLNDEKNST